MSIKPISSKIPLDLHDTYLDQRLKIAALTAAAAFLVISALIVIGCTCMCLALPGINVVNDVVLKGILPSLGAIAISIPFIVISFRKTIRNKAVRKQIVEKLYQDLPTSGTKKERMDQLESLILKSWSHEYKSGLFTEIKERFPSKKEEQTQEQKDLLEAITAFEEKIAPKKKKERDRLEKEAESAENNTPIKS